MFLFLSGRAKNGKHGTLSMVFNNDMDLWDHTFIFSNIYKGRLYIDSAVNFKTKLKLKQSGWENMS